MTNHAINPDELVIGGEPRVDLLPPEVKNRYKSKVLRRVLGAAVLAAVVLVGGGVAAASWVAAQGKTQLVAAQARTDQLLADQSEYGEVLQVQSEVDAAMGARELGTSTEVDWKAYLQDVRALLPADVGIERVDVDSASPLVPYTQAAVSLQPTRVATLKLTLNSPTLPTVPEWLTALRDLPGYADGTPDKITRTESGAYLIELTLHITEAAYSNRFADTAAPEGK